MTRPRSSGSSEPSSDLFWLVFIADHLTDAFHDGILLAEGFDQEDEPGEDEVEYAILCRTRARTAADAEVQVRDAVTDLGYTAGAGRLVELSCAPETLLRRERRAVRQLDDGDVSVHSTFVGFKRSCEPAERAAISVIESSLRRRRWQIWK